MKNKEKNSTETQTHTHIAQNKKKGRNSKLMEST